MFGVAPGRGGASGLGAAGSPRGRVSEPLGRPGAGGRRSEHLGRAGRGDSRGSVALGRPRGGGRSSWVAPVRGGDSEPLSRPGRGAGVGARIRSVAPGWWRVSGLAATRLPLGRGGGSGLGGPGPGWGLRASRSPRGGGGSWGRQPGAQTRRGGAASLLSHGGVRAQRYSRGAAAASPLSPGDGRDPRPLRALEGAAPVLYPTLTAAGHGPPAPVPPVWGPRGPQGCA